MIGNLENDMEKYYSSNLMPQYCINVNFVNEMSLPLPVPGPVIVLKFVITPLNELCQGIEVKKNDWQ